MTANPYSPPTELSLREANAIVSRARRGPAIYIAGVGLLGGIGAIPFLASQNPFGYLVICVGCIAGGLIYRVRSRNWPRDPTIRKRQFLYSMLAMILPPGVLSLILGSLYREDVMIRGLIFGVSVACGIVVSGTRRLNAVQKT